MNPGLRSIVPMLLFVAIGCDGDDKSPKVEPAAPSPAKVEAPVKPEIEPPAPSPDPAPAPAPAVEKPKPDLPGKSIVLPDKPAFPKSTAPTRYPDGAWSIAGLREALDVNVAAGEAGTEVEVRAVVQEIYVPPTCPASEVCPPAKQPHAWVVDDPTDTGKRRAMMVVNYAFAIPEWDAAVWVGQPDVVLERDKAYTFKGKFKQFSDTGFAYDRGLLEFVAVQSVAADGTKTWVYPQGAPWHPLEISRQEAANAALLEKALEAAKQAPPPRKRVPI